MTVRSLLPHPALSVVLLVVWIIVNESATVGSTLVGAGLAILIPAFARRLFPQREERIRWRPILRLLRVFLVDMIVANVVVVRIVMAPRLRAEPRFIAVPLELTNPFAAAILASIVTLTPGTVSATADVGERVLWIHGLDVDDPDVVIRHIKERYEQPLKEIFS